MTRGCKIFLRVAVLLLFGGMLFSRCANIMTPDGGPKDTLPPVIVKLEPGNFAIFFPREGHAPCIACGENPAPVRKVVLKLHKSLFE
jgi:hypothetical protein